MTNMVKSENPLLISKETMKKAGSVIHLVNDRIFFFDRWVPCDDSSSGHYTVSLGHDQVTVEEVGLALGEAGGDKSALV